MLKSENWKVSNLEGAFRAMRNLSQSWSQSDSNTNYIEQKLEGIDDNGQKTYVTITTEEFEAGPNDLEFAKRMCTIGGIYKEFMKHIIVSVDVTAPLYFWNTFDPLHINYIQCPMMQSFMNINNSNHSLTKFYNNFSDDLVDRNDHYDLSKHDTFEKMIEWCKGKDVYKEIIQSLPLGWNEKRTLLFNYHDLYTIFENKSTSLEWNTFCDEIIQNCKYSKELVWDVLSEKTLNNNKAEDYDRVVYNLQRYQMVYGSLNEEQIAAADVKLHLEDEARKKYNGKMVVAVRPLAPDEEPQEEEQPETEPPFDDNIVDAEPEEVVEDPTPVVETVPVKSRKKKSK